MFDTKDIILMAVFAAAVFTHLTISFITKYFGQQRAQQQISDGKLNEVPAKLTKTDLNNNLIRFHRDVKSFGTYEYEVEGEQYTVKLAFLEKEPPAELTLYYADNPQNADVLQHADILSLTEKLIIFAIITIAFFFIFFTQLSISSMAA